MVPKLKRIPKLRNSNMSDIPVTISAFNIGILVTPRITEREEDFILLSPKHAHTPMTVAMAEDNRAIKSVVYRACMISLFVNSEPYHLNVNPPHFALVLLLLKLKMIRVNIGA